MSHSIVNPPNLHNPVAFGYSHTASVPAGTELVFVAGQYASDAQGMLAATPFGDQVARTFANLATALEAHGMTLHNVVQLRTYVVGLDFERLGAVSAHVGQVWGDQPPTQTLIGIAGLALPEILVEVEAIAARS
jgi:enamine deaminase RidA (YjgF/YER057c/UK114 family)